MIPVALENRVHTTHCGVTVGGVVGEFADVAKAIKLVADPIDTQGRSRFQDPVVDVPSAHTTIPRSGSGQAGTGLTIQRVVGTAVDISLLAETNRPAAASTVIGGLPTERGEFGRDHRPGQRLAQEDPNFAGSQTEGARIAVRAGERLLKLQSADVFEIVKLTLVTLEEEHYRIRSQFHHGARGNGSSGDGINSADVERQNISYGCAAGQSGLDWRSNVVCLS